MTFKLTIFLKSLSFVLLLANTCLAQNKDSIAIVNTNWNSINVYKGITLKQKQFKDSGLFNSNQFISILEIKNRKISILAADTLCSTSNFVKKHKAKAGINGSFFAFNNPYNSVDYLRINNKELAPNNYNNSNKRLHHQLGAIAIKKGNLQILKAPLDNLGWERSIKAESVLVSGPLLRKEEIDQELLNVSFYTKRHPRTAIALMKDATILFIVVDGRAKEAAGMSLKELRDICKWLGAKDIINLDGGGSSTMVIFKTDSTLIVNHPCDNKGERKVANSIVVQ